MISSILDFYSSFNLRPHTTHPLDITFFITHICVRPKAQKIFSLKQFSKKDEKEKNENFPFFAHSLPSDGSLSLSLFQCGEKQKGKKKKTKINKNVQRRKGFLFQQGLFSFKAWKLKCWRDPWMNASYPDSLSTLKVQRLNYAKEFLTSNRVSLRGETQQ